MSQISDRSSGSKVIQIGGAICTERHVVIEGIRSGRHEIHFAHTPGNRLYSTLSNCQSLETSQYKINGGQGYIQKGAISHKRKRPKQLEDIDMAATTDNSHSMGMQNMISYTPFAPISSVNQKFHQYQGANNYSQRQGEFNSIKTNNLNLNGSNIVNYIAKHQKNYKGGLPSHNSQQQIAQARSYYNQETTPNMVTHYQSGNTIQNHSTVRTNECESRLAFHVKYNREAFAQPKQLHINPQSLSTSDRVSLQGGGKCQALDLQQQHMIAESQRYKCDMLNPIQDRNNSQNSSTLIYHSRSQVFPGTNYPPGVPLSNNTSYPEVPNIEFNNTNEAPSPTQYLQLDSPHISSQDIYANPEHNSSGTHIPSHTLRTNNFYKNTSQIQRYLGYQNMYSQSQIPNNYYPLVTNAADLARGVQETLYYQQLTNANSRPPQRINEYGKTLSNSAPYIGLNRLYEALPLHLQSNAREDVTANCIPAISTHKKLHVTPLNTLLSAVDVVSKRNDIDKITIEKEKTNGYIKETCKLKLKAKGKISSNSVKRKQTNDSIMPQKAYKISSTILEKRQKQLNAAQAKLLQLQANNPLMKANDSKNHEVLAKHNNVSSHNESLPVQECKEAYGKTHQQFQPSKLKKLPEQKQLIASQQTSAPVNKTVVIFCKRDFLRYQAVKLWRKYKQQNERSQKRIRVNQNGKRTRFQRLLTSPSKDEKRPTSDENKSSKRKKKQKVLESPQIDEQRPDEISQDMASATEIQTVPKLHIDRIDSITSTEILEVSAS